MNGWLLSLSAVMAEDVPFVRGLDHLQRITLLSSTTFWLQNGTLSKMVKNFPRMLPRVPTPKFGGNARRDMSGKRLLICVTKGMAALFAATNE